MGSGVHFENSNFNLANVKNKIWVVSGLGCFEPFDFHKTGLRVHKYCLLFTAN